LSASYIIADMSDLRASLDATSTSDAGQDAASTAQDWHREWFSVLPELEELARFVSFIMSVRLA
jgi:hypothetical protein